MSNAKTPAACCELHEWHLVDDIGNWLHPLPGTRIVREFAADPGIWNDSRCELPHKELRQLIQTAGGITCGHALSATTLQSGAIHLGNGIHRWTVAADLGILAVPVKMAYEVDQTWTWV